MASATTPFDDRDGFIWFDGAFRPWREANVHVLNHGLHYASSVFEGLRVYGGRIFKVREHMERLHRSAELLDFEIPFSVADLNAAAEETVKRNNVVDGYVRPVAFRGSEMMAISAQQSTTHVAIAAWSWPSYFSEEARSRGLKLEVSKWRRPSPETAPTASKAAGLYMICTMSKHHAERSGCDDALMLDFRGNLAEATGANLFLVIENELHTPTTECILNGITRLTIIDLAKQMNIPVMERVLPFDELKRATEVFLTGSAAEVTPVGAIGGQKFDVGPITRRMMDAYGKLVRGEGGLPPQAPE